MKIDWKVVGTFLWRYGDALLLMTLGVAVLGLAAVGHAPNQSTLVALSLAMLSGIAFMFIRDRRDMQNLEALERLARTAPRLKA